MNEQEQRAVLERASELLRVGWCQNAAARNSAGRSVVVESSEAVSFCLSGAINRARIELKLGPVTTVANRLKKRCDSPRAFGLWRWNDAAGRTRAQVVTLVEAELAALNE